MSPIVIKGLEAIIGRSNPNSGLTHMHDMNAAKAMFLLLHEAGEPLVSWEIKSYASSHGWKAADAKELAELGALIGGGEKPQIDGGPWWKERLIDQWKNEE